MIYLDYQATTPLPSEVFEAMTPWLKDYFANPHSAHRPGRAAAAAVEVARDQVAALLPPEGRVVFTSGATEALNIGLVGAARSMRGRDARRVRILLPDTEHAAVRDTALALRTEGFDPVLLPVRQDGLLDLAVVKDALDERTAVLAVMLVNNEIGVIQPVDTLGLMAQGAGALFLCDAVQGVGRVDLPAEADIIAISAHKIHGPKGIGALWVRNGIDLPPLIHGGGQEGGLRSGTLSPALCAGIGVASRLMAERREADATHVATLHARARELFAGWTLNGSVDHRYLGNLNLRREGLDAARLMADCRDVAFSLGSACASGSGRPSHVLRALGLSDAQARSSIRLGFGRYTTLDEIERAAEIINRAAQAQE
ncbi:cysteine desulfurase family protein [Sphingobium sp. DEHP117]|uniref:cysteine desulfurase family protein n=1 Tax=Sphingobium sp. DEHP117 TaxID=2993436 RepID=UPI0027D61E30|nr:aminotransferase class V-fold PLP-dependent enzyme [Sphingobium sp. DEHP117]MDQ4420101.1 cysteine desulfurase family protein [Sphingobium sp. DEHP117]